MIKAAPATVHTQVADMKQWRTWTVWHQRDPQIKNSYSDQQAVVGSWAAWESKTEGNGRSTLTEVSPTRVVYDLEFPDVGMRMVGVFDLAPQADGVRVVWSTSGDLGMNPMNRWFGLFLDRLMGPDFEAGLANLKRNLEKETAAARLQGRLAPRRALRTLRPVSPAEELKELLQREPRWSVAAAESLTAGHVQALIAAVPGSSNYFRGGITAYTVDGKVRHLGVDRRAAEACNGVSRDVAEQMARGACRLFDADFAVATTGYAEPNAARGVPVPQAWWAVAQRFADGRDRVRSELVEFPGSSRTQAQAGVAAAALAGLLAFLQRARAD